VTDRGPEAPSLARRVERVTWAGWACAALHAVLAATTYNNARLYPWVAGYDAAAHVEYARGLVERWELPSTGTYYTPPVFYLLAGAAMELGDLVGLDEPERAGQYLSAALTVLTGLLLLGLVRTLFPARPVVHVSALAFFVASPTVLKTAAMFHPQPLVLALSTLALLLAARMLVRDRYPWWELVGLALALGVAQLVRSVALWTVGVVVVALAVGLIRRLRGRRLAVTLAALLVAVVVIPLPWYVYLQRNYSNPIFGREGASLLHSHPIGFYVDPGLPELLTHPQRQDLPRRFLPILYADAWGDHFGFWSWGIPPGDVTPSANRRLAVQSWAGIAPTFIAFAGWLGLLALSLARWRVRTELLLVTLLPGAALLGMLYYAARTTSADVDTVKGVFGLTAVPAWAACLGFAADAVWTRSRRVGIGLGAILAVSGLACLEYGWL
jgi:hypothetical protein